MKFHTFNTFLIYTFLLEGGIFMRKYIAMILICTLFFAPNVDAHTMDQEMLYSDVPKTTPNLQEIMVLHSIGLLGYNGVDMALNSSENLTRKDFAGWVGAFFGLEGSTVDELAQAALNEEYVSSLEGDITYKEINLALFHQQLELEHPNATLTKEEYINFLTANLDVDMGGHTLLQMGGFAYGPTGIIEEVKTGENIGLVIDGETYMLSGHPRIFADSTEPESWVGQTLEKSILTTNGGHGHHGGHGTAEADTSAANKALQYIQIGTETKETSEATEQVQPETNATPKNEQVSKESSETSQSSSLWMIIGGAILLLAVVGIIFWKRKK